jgi:hypothetical protein
VSGDAPPSNPAGSTAQLSLPEPARWLLWLTFGASASWALGSFDWPWLPLLDRLFAALGISLLLTSLGWFFLLALQRGGLWAIAMLIPYANVIAASWFARRYWAAGARGPSLLALGALLLQLALLLRWILDPPLAVLV